MYVEQRIHTAHPGQLPAWIDLQPPSAAALPTSIWAR